jgi:cell division protein FtsW (lipid II flippase)
MNILRILVIIGDIGIFGWIIFMIATEGTSGSEWIFILAILLLIMLNVFFLASNKQGGDGWFSLILKRKALEEKKKIADLENKIKI